MLLQLTPPRARCSGGSSYYCSCCHAGSFTGELPSELTGLHDLTELRLSRNGLWGPLRHLDRLTTLTVLDLSCNSLGGEVPDSFSDLRRLEVGYLRMQQYAYCCCC